MGGEVPLALHPHLLISNQPYFRDVSRLKYAVLIPLLIDLYYVYQPMTSEATGSLGSYLHQSDYHEQ